MPAQLTIPNKEDTFGDFEICSNAFSIDSFLLTSISTNSKREFKKGDSAYDFSNKFNFTSVAKMKPIMKIELDLKKLNIKKKKKIN